jgi:hypothetical protein
MGTVRSCAAQLPRLLAMKTIYLTVRHGSGVAVCGKGLRLCNCLTRRIGRGPILEELSERSESVMWPIEPWKAWSERMRTVSVDR